MSDLCKEAFERLKKRINKALVICEVNKNIESEKTTHFSEGFESGASMCAHDIEKALRGEHDI